MHTNSYVTSQCTQIVTPRHNPSKRNCVTFIQTSSTSQRLCQMVLVLCKVTINCITTTITIINIDDIIYLQPKYASAWTPVISHLMSEETPLWLVNIYSGLKFCPSILKTVGYRVPTETSEILLRLMLILNFANVLLHAYRLLMSQRSSLINP